MRFLFLNSCVTSNNNYAYFELWDNNIYKSLVGYISHLFLLQQPFVELQSHNLKQLVKYMLAFIIHNHFNADCYLDEQMEEERWDLELKAYKVLMIT